MWFGLFCGGVGLLCCLDCCLMRELWDLMMVGNFVVY